MTGLAPDNLCEMKGWVREVYGVTFALLQHLHAVVKREGGDPAAAVRSLLLAERTRQRHRTEGHGVAGGVS